MAKKAVAHQGHRYIDDRGYYCWRLSLGSRESCRPFVIKRKSFAEREKAIRAKLKELDEMGILVRSRDDVTVKDRLNWWLENKIEQHREPKTFESYESTCRLHVIPAIGNVKLAKLQPDHVQTLVTAVKRKALSDRSAHYAVQVLLRGLPKKEAALLRSSLGGSDVSIPADSKPRDRILSLAEISAVLERAYEEVPVAGKPGEIRFRCRDRFLLDLLLNSGLRISEALGLLKIDFDRANGGLHIRRQLEWQKDAWQLKERTKTGGDRYVPLTQAGMEALAGQLEMVGAEALRAGEGYEDYGLLFPTASGRPMHRRNVLRSLNLLIKRARVTTEEGFLAKMPHATLHDLRRSYGTHFANSEPRMHIVSAVLGHKNLETTKKYYVFAQNKELTEAVRNFSFNQPLSIPSVPSSVPRDEKRA